MGNCGGAYLLALDHTLCLHLLSFAQIVVLAWCIVGEAEGLLDSVQVAQTVYSPSSLYSHPVVAFQITRYYHPYP